MLCVFCKLFTSPTLKSFAITNGVSMASHALLKILICGIECVVAGMSEVIMSQAISLIEFNMEMVLYSGTSIIIITIMI